MERKLKDFFHRRTGSRKDIAPSSPRSEHKSEEGRPHPAQRLDSSDLQTKKRPQSWIQPNGTFSATRTSPDRGRSTPVAAHDSNPPPKPPPKQDSNANNETIRMITSTPLQTPGSITDRSIADNYVAYLPSLHGSGGTKGSAGTQESSRHMTLGRDTQFMTDLSVMKHQEDIANRNIANRSGPASRNSSLHTADKFAPRGSAGSIGGLALAVAALKEEQGEDVSNTESPASYTANRSSWPSRAARDERHTSYRRRRSKNDSTDDNAPRPSDYGPRWDAKESKPDIVDGMSDNEANAAQKEKLLANPALDGVVDLHDSEDVDRTTTIAPAVTHEVIKPHTHEIVTEQIHREIHNYEVHHRIQPVYDTEILPARHFIPSTSSPNELIEVYEKDLPNCTGANQRWTINQRIPPPNEHFHTHQATLSEPKAVANRTFKNNDGWDRRETTWLHPAELDDMSGYAGPVMPVHFGPDGQHEERPKSEITTMKELDGALHELDLRKSLSSGASPSTSPIHRKPVPLPKDGTMVTPPKRYSSLRHSMNGSLNGSAVNGVKV